jgi:hypothetical protein
MPLMPIPPMPIKWIGPMSRGSFMRFPGFVPAFQRLFHVYK